MQRPCYAFDHEPTVDEMRATAVRAMRDELSVPWFTAQTIAYRKKGAVEGKLFQFEEGKRFAGMPYTSAGKGIFQWWEYYCEATGEMQYHDSEGFNATIGNTCASSAAWGLFAVCTSMRGRCISRFLTYDNGYFPLGEVRYPESVTDFDTYTTTRILEEVGEETVMGGYALARPGDLLCFSDGGPSGGHTMMAIEDAFVVRREDGTINPTESFVFVQDQRPGFYRIPGEDGTERLYSGRIRHCATFAELLKGRYLALTVAEFQGKKAYEKAYVRAEGFDGASSFERTVLRSNYPMAVVKMILNCGGKKTLLARTLFTRVEIESGEAFAYPLAALAKEFHTAPGGEIRVEATVSTGEIFCPIRTTVEKEA